MTKEEYKTIYDDNLNSTDDHPRIDLSQDDIRAWADRIVDSINAFNSAVYSLEYGVLDDGEYEHQITPSGTIYPDERYYDPEIFLFRGIDLLADALGEQLHAIDGWGRDYRYKIWFDYRGVLFYQIGNELPEKGVILDE